MSWQGEEEGNDPQDDPDEGEEREEEEPGEEAEVIDGDGEAFHGYFNSGGLGNT